MGNRNYNEVWHRIQDDSGREIYPGDIAFSAQTKLGILEQRRHSSCVQYLHVLLRITQEDFGDQGAGHQQWTQSLDTNAEGTSEPNWFGGGNELLWLKSVENGQTQLIVGSADEVGMSFVAGLVPTTILDVKLKSWLLCPRVEENGLLSLKRAWQETPAVIVRFWAVVGLKIGQSISAWGSERHAVTILYLHYILN